MFSTINRDNGKLESSRIETDEHLAGAGEQETPTEIGAPRYKVAIIAPTCFYYQVALFRELNDHPRIDLTVYFCSDEAISARDVLKMYNTSAAWGDEGDLLHGFNYQFMRNFSPRPSYLKWPFGLMNFSVWNKIKNGRPDVVILMSWMNTTWWLSIMACLSYKIPILFLTDANGDAEPRGSFLKKRIKKFILGDILFPSVSGFLCAGKANRELYSSFGVPDEKLVPFAYSWGYESFLRSAKELKPERARLRSELSIPADSKVILFCGRLSDEKCPAHLLEAFQLIDSDKKVLVFVGDGNLRKPLEKYVAENGMKSVRFLGFQNRLAVPNYYAIADVFVLPSRRETWGMVVNEAMCFGLPIIASDQVGAGKDLVKNDYNGFIFPSGEISQLSQHIDNLISMPAEEIELMGRRSVEMITEWSNQKVCDSLLNFIDQIQSKKKKTAKP